MPQRVERKLMAILAADVAGYSKLMGADEEGTLARLKAHRQRLVDPKITKHRGRIIKTTGDGLLAEFPSAVDAVRCAVEVQRGMIAGNVDVPPKKKFKFRVGINVGDIMLHGGDIFGAGVNVAARLENLAEPGGICVSGRVQEDVRHEHQNIVAVLTGHSSRTVKRGLHSTRATGRSGQISSNRCAKRHVIAAAARGHHVACRRSVNGTTG